MFAAAQDEEMINRFRPSLVEADVIKEQNLALDYIGIRGSIENAGRVSRHSHTYLYFLYQWASHPRARRFLSHVSPFSAL